MINTFTALSTPFKFLELTARHLWAEHKSFRALVAYGTLIKLSRFAAFLLPFKALMLEISDERILSIGGHELSTKTLAAIILVAAAAFFLGQWLARGQYERHMARLFGEHNTTEAPAAPTRDSHNEQLFRSTVDFVASQLLALLLIVTSVLIVHWIALVILPISAIYFANLARLLEVHKAGKPDLSWHNNVFSFATMISVLVLLGVLTRFHAVTPLPALFVFIASRQLLTSYAEISAAIVRHRNPVVPHFLKNSVGNVPPAPRAPLPPFLRSEERDRWLLERLQGPDNEPSAIETASWLYSGSKSLQCFVVKARTTSGTTHSYVLNIFPERERELAQTEHACVRSLQTPLCLPLRTLSTDSEHLTFVYEFDGDLSDEKLLPGRSPEILGNLCSISADALGAIATHRGAFLQSIDEDSIDMLSTAAAAQQANVQQFACKLSTAKTIVNQLPNALINPSTSPSTLLRERSGCVKLLTWSRASVEPIGCQLQFLPRLNDADLNEVLIRLKTSRSDCRDLDVAHLRLASALFGISRKIAKGTLMGAIADVEDAVAALRQLA